MTDQQLQVVTGLIAGVELAIVHLASVLDAKGIESKAALAASFQATGAAIPPDVVNREPMAMVLRQIALGIAGSGPAGNPEEELRKLLH